MLSATPTGRESREGKVAGAGGRGTGAPIGRDDPIGSDVCDTRGNKIKIALGNFLKGWARSERPYVGNGTVGCGGGGL